MQQKSRMYFTETCFQTAGGIIMTREELKKKKKSELIEMIMELRQDKKELVKVIGVIGTTPCSHIKLEDKMYDYD